MGLIGLKSRCWQSRFLLEALEENLVSLRFAILEAVYILDLWPHPLPSKPAVAVQIFVMMPSDSSSASFSI